MRDNGFRCLSSKITNCREAIFDYSFVVIHSENMDTETAIPRDFLFLSKFIFMISHTCMKKETQVANRSMQI